MSPLRRQSFHRVLPSALQTSSPVEEDLAKASAWDDEDTSTLVAPKWKGKGKQQDGDEDDRTVSGDNLPREIGEYPPMAEEDVESRKVEEHLKRWETLEKHRRKVARESRSSRQESISLSSSFSMSDVSRRASQLWHGRGSRERPKQAVDSSHPHRILENVDEVVHRDDSSSQSASSPADTPRTSTSETLPTPSTSRSTFNTTNPFENAQYIEVPEASSPTMTPTRSHFTPTTPRNRSGNAPSRPTLQVREPSPRKPPTRSPDSSASPGSLPRPQRPTEIENRERGEQKRWWTDWLCGCREEGEYQTGRTNPME